MGRESGHLTMSHSPPPFKVPHAFNSGDILGFRGYPSVSLWYSAFSVLLASFFFLLLEVYSHRLVLFPFHSLCPSGLVHFYFFVLTFIEHKCLCSVHHVLSCTLPLTSPFPKIDWNHLLFSFIAFVII